MSVLWSTNQRARKEHWCDWCGDRICLGEFYSRTVWTAGSRLEVTKQHDVCPEDALGLRPIEVPEAVQFSYAIRMEAVQRILLGGGIETQFEPRCVLVPVSEPELPNEGTLDDDVPF